MKNSSNKILSAAVILLLIANIALVAFMVFGKSKRGDMRKGGRPDPIETMTKELSLTDQQQKDLKQMRDDFFKTNKTIFDSMRAAKAAMFSLVKDPAANDSVIESYSRKISDIQASADKITFAHFRRVRAMLTPEQQPKYDEFLKKMMMLRGRRDSADHKDK
jgi:Spy/CpxP family protein refolding chaperone